jgi:cell wall-associated NlpC family hydrolase
MMEIERKGASMSGLTIDNLHAIQAKALNTSTKTTVSGSSGFAQMLASKMQSQSAEQSSSSKISSYYTMKTYQALQNADQTENTESTTETSTDKTDNTDSLKDNKNLLMLLCLMMMSNSSEDDSGGMSSMLISLIAGLGDSSSDTASSIAQYSLINNLTNLANTSNSTQSSATGSAIVENALTRLGDPYSKSKRGTGNYVDCSYLAKWAYAQAGISIPSTAASQAKYCYENGYTISKDELQPGDLIFWTKKGADGGRWRDIHHVAIYMGDNKIVEAKTSTGGVVVDDLWEGGRWQITMYARPY